MRTFSNKNHGNRRSDEAGFTPRNTPLSSSSERAKKKGKGIRICLMFSPFPVTRDMVGVFFVVSHT